MPDVGPAGARTMSAPSPETGARQLAAGIEEIAAGRPVVLLGDPSQHGEADLVFAAALSTPELMAWCVRVTAGFVCVALTTGRCDDLRLPPQRWAPFLDGHPYCVTVDAAGTGTGISARDRSRTARALADPGATHRQFTRPGHVVPLRAGAGSRTADAAVRLSALAGLSAASVVSRLVSEENPHRMARGAEARRFADRYSLRTVSVAAALGCLL